MGVPWVFWALGLMAWHLGRSSASLENLTLAIVLPKDNLAYPWAWPRVGPAIKLAIDQINHDPDLLADLHVQSVFGNSEDKHGNCSDSAAPLVAVDLQFAYKPNAFIGPGCVYTSAPVARFTGHWKVPLITAGAAAFGFDNKKDMYPLTTRTGPSHTKLGEYVAHIHRQFNWTTRAMIIYMDEKTDDRPCFFAAEGLYVELPKFNNLTVVDMQFKEKDMTNYTSVIQDIKQKGRIVYICCSPDTFRQLMLQAWREGLCNGDYAFFYIDVFGASLQGTQFPDPEGPWKRGDAEDKHAMEAFKAVMIITYREPENPEYRQFLEETKLYAAKYFNYTVTDSLMNYIAAGFHDGVLLYAQAMNETMAHGGSQHDGPAVTRQMWNRTFYGVTGYMRIDENGDRENDYSLWDMADSGNGTFQIVSNFNGSIKKIIPVPGREIHWPRNRIPLDVPPCGFDNSNPACRKVSLTVLEIMSIVVSLFLLGIIISSIFVYRKLRLEKELAAQLWRIRWEDIQTSNMEKNLRSAGSKMTLSLETDDTPTPDWTNLLQKLDHTPIVDWPGAPI